jgi:hypothetical protein
MGTACERCRHGFHHVAPARAAAIPRRRRWAHPSLRSSRRDARGDGGDVRAQARRRLHDPPEPERVTESLARSSTTCGRRSSFRPTRTGAALAFRALGIPSRRSFRHLCQLPRRELFGYPPPTGGIWAAEGACGAARALRLRGAHVHLRFNEALPTWPPHAQLSEDAFAAGVAGHVELPGQPRRPRGRGRCDTCRPLRPRRSRTTRTDAWSRRDAEGVRRARQLPLGALGCPARGSPTAHGAGLDAVTRRVTPQDDLDRCRRGGRPPRLPQVTALRACDIVICHGGTTRSWRR